MSNRSRRESQEPVLLPLKDLAERASVSISLLRRLIWSGELQAVKVGRIVRVRLEDWEGFLSSHRVGGRPKRVLPR